MPQFPLFRQQQVNTEDSPEQEWTPPDYAQPVAESKTGSWAPPSYAGKPIKIETAHDKAKKNVTFFGSLKSAVDETKRTPLAKSVGQFVEGVSAVPKSMYDTVRKTGTEAASQIRSGDIHGAFDTVTSPLMGGINAVNKMLEDKAYGRDTQLPVKSDAKHEIASQLTGAVGLPWDEISTAYKEGNYSKLAGMGLTAAAITGLAHYVGSEKAPATAPERGTPIRQADRRALSLKDTTPQQDNVAIALTKDNVPRTPANISTETGIPKASIRRTISEIKKKTSPQETPKTTEDATTTEPTGLTDFIKQNPTAKMSEIEQFIKSVDESNKRPPPPPSGAMIGLKEEGAGPEASDWNRKHVVLPKEPSIKQPLVNPFEKQPDVKPTAKFAFHQDNFEGGSFPMYNIEGGVADKSTVTAETLTKEGIDIPPTPQSDLPVRPPGPWDKNVSQETPQTPAIKASEPIKRDILKDYTGEKFNEDSYNKARERLNMGLDNPAAEPAQKTDFVNPFEKAKTEAAANEWKAPDYAKPAEEAQPTAETAHPLSGDNTVELQGGLGGFKPSNRELNPSTGPYGAALDKLFNSMGDISEKRVQQDALNKVERARRFAAFSGVKDVGVSGAAQSLSKLKGEFEKVDFDKVKMTPPQVDSLFTAVKRANITPGEKARGYTTLFKIFNGDLPQRNELSVLDSVFGNNFSNRIVEMHGGIGAVGMKLSKLNSTAKSMENSISLAAPLRHGLALSYRKEFYPAYRDMFKFFANKETFQASMQAIEEHPDYMKYREAGGFFAKSGSLLNSEEDFLNSYVGDLPKFTGIPQTVAASQRAYVGFLNKLRFDTYKAMTQRAEDLGNSLFTEVKDKDGNVSHVASKEARAITTYINTATGRGNLGVLNKITNEMNMLFFSPRMVASRFQMFNPKLYTNLPKGMRLEGMKSLLAVASLGTIVNTLGLLGGAKVSNNILSTDFMKSRFGDHVIDPWGSFQQIIVGTARFLAGKTDSSMPTSRLAIAGRFLANKESPAASLVHTMLTAKAFTGDSNDPKTAGNLTTEYGQKTSVQTEVMKRYAPIFVQDLADLIASEPDWSENIGLTAAMSAASLAGMAQDYPEKKHGLSLGKMRLGKVSSLK